MSSAVPIGVLLGVGEKLSAYSLTSGDITLTINGVNITQTPVAFGLDHPTEPQAGFYTTFNITAHTTLESLTEYPYTLTQVGNTGSVSSSFISDPVAGDKFNLTALTCDKNYGTLLQTPNDEGYDRYLSVESAASNIPYFGFIGPDDMSGYVDSLSVDDSTGSGLVSTGAPSSTGLEFDYALGYMCLLGLLTTQDGAEVADGNYRAIDFGRWPSRVNRFQTKKALCQFGDHEFKNDIGWDLPTNDVTGSPSNATLFAAGKNIWDVFFGSVQPPVLSVNSNAWGIRLGDVYICAPDYITNAIGTYTATGTVSQLYGAAQRTDILNAMNNDAPIKILALGHGIRYLYDPASAVEFQSGTQHPLYDHVLSEYQLLFTATGNTPPSLMDNPYCNGLLCPLILLHGDYHRMKVEHHQAPAYTGNAAENFYSISLGTNNGSTNFGLTSGGIDTDYLASGKSSILYAYENGIKLPVGGANPNLTSLEALGKDWTDAHTGVDFWGVHIKVDGSVWPKTCEIDVRGASSEAEANARNYDSVLWNKKFTQRRGGNEAHDLSASLVVKAAINIVI